MIILVELELPSLHIAIDEDAKPLQEIIAMSIKLDDVRNQMCLKMTTIWKWHKIYYDNKMKLKRPSAADLVLLYDSHFYI